MRKLTKRQQSVADKIIRIGKQRGASEDQIKWALKSAKIESSLGAKEENEPLPGQNKTSAKGVFQYVNKTWDIKETLAMMKITLKPSIKT